MMSYKDKAFCASPNCKNECGRKLTEEQRQEAVSKNMFIAYAYFCDVPDGVFPAIPKEFQAGMKK